MRGLAILIVFAGHVALYGATESQRSMLPVQFLASNVGSGVDLFFVLSGFLITGILHDSKGAPAYFRRFFARRVLRIFPLYYAVLAGIAVATLLFPGLYALNSIPLASHIANWTYTSNFLMAFRGWGAEPAFLGHFWSLAVEEQFYLLWPFCVFFLNRNRLIKVCVAGIVAAPVFRIIALNNLSFAAAYALLPSRMDALLIGAAIALLARSEYGLQGWIKSPLLLALILTAFVGEIVNREFALIPLPLSVAMPLPYSIDPLAYGALLVSLVFRERQSWWKEIFRSRFLRFFGKYSYAIYVFHIAVIIVLHTMVEKFARFWRPGVVEFAIAALCVTVIAALISWNLVEKRALALKDRLVFDPPPVASDAACAGSTAL
jgi:peptidoglycan/LPS O-acetylase OafA/YrhL